MIHIQNICPRKAFEIFATCGFHVLKSATVNESNVACEFTDLNLANADDFDLAEKVQELGFFQAWKKSE